MGGSCNFVPPAPSCPGGVCPLMKKDKDVSLDKSNDLDKEHSSSDTSCPNSDPGFNKIIGNRTPEERSKLFYICVLVRTLLYTGVYMYRDEPWMAPLVGTLSLASIFQLTRPSENKQWWSKKFQLVMAILVLLSAIAVKFYGIDSRSMSALLFISLIGGVIQRTQTKLC